MMECQKVAPKFDTCKKPFLDLVLNYVGIKNIKTIQSMNKYNSYEKMLDDLMIPFIFYVKTGWP